MWGRAGSQIKGLPRLLDEGQKGKPVANSLGPRLLRDSCKEVLRANNTEWVGGQKE